MLIDSVCTKIIPTLVALVIGQVLYFNLDKKYNITSKLHLRLKLTPEQKSMFCLIALLIVMSIVNGVGIYIINLSSIFCLILSGFLTGIFNMMSIQFNKVSNQI